jgi:hypothetical protein
MYLHLIIFTQVLLIASFQFNFSTDGGSNYVVKTTSTNFSALHAENDNTTAKFRL